LLLLPVSRYACITSLSCNVSGVYSRNRDILLVKSVFVMVALQVVCY